MNNIITRIAGLACLLSISASHAAPIVYIDITGDGVMDTSGSINLGDSFSASLYVSDVDNLHGGLISWGSTLNFDNTQLSANGYSIAPSWPLAGIDNNINNAAGSAELLASSFIGQTGTIKLADIYFDTLDTGNSLLSLSDLFPGNPGFDAFAGVDGYAYDSEVIFNDLSLHITAVPLPASLLLMLSGVTALTGFALRQKS
jgi:hypothetical protein